MVIAISQVATNANSKPLTNVVIENVLIRRIGTAAQAFDIKAQNLPQVTNLALKIANSSGQISLAYSNRLYADNRLYNSTNLSGWSPQLLGIEIGSPVTNIIYLPVDTPFRFFSIAQVQSPSSTFAPKTVLGRQLILNFNAGAAGTITNNFDAAGGGTCARLRDRLCGVRGDGDSAVGASASHPGMPEWSCPWPRRDDETLRCSGAEGRRRLGR